MESNTKNKKLYISMPMHCYVKKGHDIELYRSGVHFSGMGFSMPPSITDTVVMMVAIRPFRVIRYNSTEYKQIRIGCGLYFCNMVQYEDDTNLVAVSELLHCTDESEIYVASADEINAFTIPVYYGRNKFSCPYMVSMLERKLFHGETFNILFDTRGIGVDDRSISSSTCFLEYIPLIGVLHEFLMVQEEYVHENFIHSIINILDDAKEMLMTDISPRDKESLLSQTMNVLEKLRQTINDISPYDYSGIRDVDSVIEEYYATEMKEADKKAREQDRLRTEQARKDAEKRAENNRKKEEYMKKIASRLELIDYFNSK